MTTTRLPTYFISHGAGPWPWLDESVMPVNFELPGDALRAIPGEVGRKPKAILLVSAPLHTYEIQYPAPGAPTVAARVGQLLAEAGIEVRFDDTSGFDHGVYAPLAVAYPDADDMRVRNVPEESKAFDAWLTETMVGHDGQDRVRRLVAWVDAPFARIAHPREDHLLPGMIAVGSAAADPGVRNYHEEDVLGWMSSSSYRFDAVDVDRVQDRVSG